MKANEITEPIIGAAIDVHRELGPGIIEKAAEPGLSDPLTSLCILRCASTANPNQ